MHPPTCSSLARPASELCDLLVIGSGAAGLAAAVTAAHHGLRVVVAEKEAQFGGTTAWSGGWMWVPGNPLAVQAGIQEAYDAPLQYLRHEVGERLDEGLARTYLDQAPRMVAFFQKNTALDFIDGNAIPDFHGRSSGAATGGRSVCAAAFDGRRLGPWLERLKPPLEETTVWGLGIAAGAEMRHFLNATRSMASAWAVLPLLLRLARDRWLHGRSTRLVNGNALVAALLRSALDLGVNLRSATPALALLNDGGRVAGAVLQTPQGPAACRAVRGVVLACGGFPHDPTRKRELLPHAPTGFEHWSAGGRGNTGDGLRLGESAGGCVATDAWQAAALAPVSLVPRSDGTVAHFPHLVDRGKPGLIAVTAAGRRFGNEADPYHDLMQALLRVTPAGTCAQAWLLCDHRFIRRYGLGAVKPHPWPLLPWLACGYLQRACTWEDLARQCGIDPQPLRRTIERYNAMAREGQDLEFDKGYSPYNRMQGDASAGWPNPCMAPLERPPFYAVKIVMGSLGTFAGLRTDVRARVIDAQGHPLPGLWAAGNDMNSLMGGHYPSGGITLGPAMTFGHLAGLDAAHALP